MTLSATTPTAGAPAPHRPSQAPGPRARLLELRVWQRFHVRLTLFYGVFVVVALGLITASVYVGGVDLAMRGIRNRLRDTTVAIARGLDADAVVAAQAVNAPTRVAGWEEATKRWP